MSKKIVALGVSVAVVVGGVIYAGMALERVQPGYVGVVYSANGGIKDTSLQQGWNFVSPLDKVRQYPVSEEILLYSAEDTEGDPGDNSISIGSKEGKYLKVNVQMNIKTDESRIAETYTRFKGRPFEGFKNDIFKQVIKSELTKISVQYPMFDIYSSKRGEVSEKAKELISTKLRDMGFIVSAFEITGVVLDAETQKAVDALQKATMDQKQVEATAKAQQAKAEAEIAVAKAEAEKAKAQAEIAIAEAKGKAEARIAQASGEAKANQLLSASLTPQLVELKKIDANVNIQKSWADAWKEGGNVPTTVMGSNGQVPLMPYQMMNLAPVTK